MLKNILLFAMVTLVQLQMAYTKGGFVPNVPDECRRLGYCNQALPDYPEDHVASLIKTLGLHNANGSVVETKPARSHDPEEVALCAYIEEELIPSAAQDTNGTWHFIINSKLQYKQTYVVEICNKADFPCSPVAHFRVGYHASCQQNFITKLMLALDHEGKKIEKEFRIPSNCYCKVKENGEKNSEHSMTRMIQHGDFNRV